MNPTFMYIAGSIIAVAVATSAGLQIWTLIRLRPLLDRLEDTAQFLEASRPKIDRILNDAEAELVQLRGVSAKLNRIAGHAESVTAGLKVAVQPFVTEVSDLGQLVRHARATAVAIRTGLLAWRGQRHSAVDEPVSEIEYDEES